MEVTIETPYGPLTVRCHDGYSLSVFAEQIVLSRVTYMLRLGVVDADSSAAAKPLADIASLAQTSWRVTRESLWHALTRKQWDNYRASGPTDAARRELSDQLLPHIAAWLASSEADEFARSARNAERARLADQAKQKAASLRGAAAVLDDAAKRARAGEDLPEALRHAVTYGYRVEGAWEEAKA